jgi:hypothetical protein
MLLIRPLSRCDEATIAVDGKISMEDKMRTIMTLALTTLLMLASAAVASADSNFPEAPGAHVAGGCLAVTSNPGSSIGGTAMMNASQTAVAITLALLKDACTPGQ